jgi:hypothetical protein
MNDDDLPDNGKMKRFVLDRIVDATGVSGEGIVAEGVKFTGGKCAMHWLSDFSSVAVYDSILELEAIHCHEGKSKIVWVD